MALWGSKASSSWPLPLAVGTGEGLVSLRGGSELGSELALNPGMGWQGRSLGIPVSLWEVT